MSAPEGFLATLPKFDDSVSGERDLARPPLRGASADHVGPYRLLQPIGAGGMGTVWLAKRRDGLIDRLVALKLPHDTRARSGLAERLERERDILSALEHPNIARLYDAGVSAEGQPYLVLEYVDGQRIDEYCKARALDVDRKLELFLQVASAVAHAHAKLVVHRDIKPANILVDVRGVARLLDFGIAKLRFADEEAEGGLTQRVGRALTPEYASPEQLAGEPAWVASDIYSLGVVLCELLTGQRPHPPRRLGLPLPALEPERARPPSRLTDDPRLRARLRGDLDTIALKAVKPLPQERYPTVHAMMEDIVRHRSGRPVLARVDTFWYLGSKWVARHKPLCAAALSACLLCGVAVAALLGVATTSSRQLRVITNVFSDIFLEMEPMRGGVLEREQLAVMLQSASRQSERLLPAGDPLRLRIELRIALLEHFAGDGPHAQARLVRVLEALRGSAAASPELVHALLLEARFALAGGQLQRAQRAAQRALEVARDLPAAAPELVAEALMGGARVHAAARRPSQALAAAAEAHALQQALRDASHPLLAEAAMDHARALLACGEVQAALPHMRRALIAAAKRHGEQASVARAYREELLQAEALLLAAAQGGSSPMSACVPASVR